MPTFDVVSEVNLHEVTNAVSQAVREISTRFDFKGKNVKLEFTDDQVTMRAPEEFQLEQLYDVLTNKFASRKVDVRCLERDSVQKNVSDVWQVVRVRQGIEIELARRLVKLVKNTKLKVQVAIQGEKLRVSGKKRDDLQTAIQVLKDANVDIPLQFINFRE
jgi:uncharacterized protein YajQ (UPF0234 family)